MKTQKMVALLIIFTMILTVPACQKKDNGNEKDTVKETASGTYDVSILEPESDLIKAWGYFSEDQLSDFARDYPQFTVETEGVVGVFEIDKTPDIPRLSAEIAAETQPDLFLAMMTPGEAYYSNLFQPVEKYLKVDPEYNVEDFDPGVFDLVTFNDVIYFVPVDFTCGVFVWNKTLLESVGLDPDKPPATWDEFLEMSEKVITYESTGAIKTIGMDPSYPWRDWHAAAFGKSFVDETGLNFQWNTKEWIETFELFKNLPNAYGGKDKLPAELRFIFNQTAFAGWNGAALRTLAEWSGEVFDFGISTFPRRDDDSPLYVPASQGASYAIPKGAKNPAGGWRLAVWDLTEGKLDNEELNYENNPNHFMPTYIIHKPTRERLYEQFEGLMKEKLVEKMKIRDEIESKRNLIIYTSPVQSKMMLFFEEKYKEFLDSSLTAKDFVEQLQAYADVIAKEFIEQKKEEGWVFEEGKDGFPPPTEQ